MRRHSPRSPHSVASNCHYEQASLPPASPLPIRLLHLFQSGLKENTRPVMSPASLNHLSGRPASPKVSSETHHPGRYNIWEKKGGDGRKGGSSARQGCEVLSTVVFLLEIHNA